MGLWSVGVVEIGPDRVWHALLFRIGVWGLCLEKMFQMCTVWCTLTAIKSLEWELYGGGLDL